MKSYFFSSGGPRSRPDLALSTENCREKAKIAIEKLDPKPKKTQKSKFSYFFLYLFISKKNHFRYGNERSLCPLLRTEEKIQEFQENRARRTSCEILKTRKIEKNKIKRLISLPKTY